MESDSARSAQAHLEALAASRELALGRIVLPWRYVIAWAIVGNACLIALVLPVLVSEGWTLLAQGFFLAAGAALLLMQRSDQRVKRPRVHIQGAWILTVVCVIGLGSALALGIYARSTDDPRLAVASLLINFSSYLLVYGGGGFLLRRQFARLT
jgi:hypothetical protein